MVAIPVLFRAERSGQFKGDVTAVFPTLPASGPDEMTCYAHVGQHSGCTRAWYYGTRPATPDEYASLLAELTGIYCTEGDTLKIVRRISPSHDTERREIWRKYP